MNARRRLNRLLLILVLFGLSVGGAVVLADRPAHAYLSPEAVSDLKATWPPKPRLRPRVRARPNVEARPPVSQPGSGPAVSVTVDVDPASPLGPMPLLLHPSSMLTGTSGEAKTTLLGLPGTLGAVRWGLGTLIDNARSLAEYSSMLDRLAPDLRRFSDRGATLIVTMEGMPAWLSSTQDTRLAGAYGWPLRKASPPKDYRAYEQFCYETVRVLNKTHGLNPYYEFWNEPNSKGFWAGSTGELFQTYAAFARGARSADPQAKVGGIATGSWDSKSDSGPRDAKPLLRQFLEYAAHPPRTEGGSRPLPVDFVSWHRFGSSPEDKWDGPAEIRGWLRDSGFSTDLPQVVDEWARWATFPAWNDAARDVAAGAAYIPVALLGMDRQRVAIQTIANLQDFNNPPAGKVFIGDFGLLTRNPMVGKAALHAMRMLGMMEPDRVAVTVPPDIEDVEGVRALASARGGRLSVLLCRYGADPSAALIRAIERAGYDSFSELGVPAQAVVAAFTKNEPLPSGTSARARDALEQALSKAHRALESSASQVVVTLRVPGDPASMKYTIYMIDDDHLNPGEAFRRAEQAGKSFDDALRAARDMETFTPTAQGGGSPPVVKLGRYAVALVIVERASLRR